MAENEHRNYRHDIEVEVLDEDVSVGQMHARTSVAALQRELQNLPDMPGRPTIVVNHIYNIHHPADRPSQQHMQDLEAYGRDYMGFINRNCLSICEKSIGMFPERNALQVIPSLRVKRYFDGKAGIPRSSAYVPDPKYRKCESREEKCRDAGVGINLKQLHESIDIPQGRQHVALVGNLGSGKTFISRRYANMVLNREVPQLDNVEVVHYISVDVLSNYSGEKFSVRKLLFDDFLTNEYVSENTRKYGYEYLCRNPGKMLLIFDGADELLSSFTDQVELISCDDCETTLVVLLQNIIRGSIFCGCRTLITAREWSLKVMTSDFRPAKIVIIGPLTTEQKVSMIKSLGYEKNVVGELLSDLQKFPASFLLMKDPAYLHFAVECLLRNDRDGIKITTDVMLILNMLQCLIRSSNCVPECPQYFTKFKKVAFLMVKEGCLRISSRCLESYCKPKPYRGIKEIRDCMVVAPQHNQAVFHRLLENDFCYFFPNQVFQEILAAFYACDMSSEEFSKFVDEELHTHRWHSVRRILCGIALHNDARHLRSNLCMNEDCHQSKLLSSLEKSVKKMDSQTPYERLELIATLHECGESVRSILEQHVRKLDLADIALEPSDVYALTRVGSYISSFTNVHVCFDVDISLEQYDQFLMIFVKKAESVTLDLSRLCIEPAHVEGLKAPFKSLVNTRQRQKRNIFLIVKKETPTVLLGKFKRIEPQFCSIEIKEVSAIDNKAKQ